MKVKKQKMYKKCVIKKILKFESYKFFLQASQLENKINSLAKNKIDVKSLIQSNKDFIIKNRLILKSQERFKNKIHNIFTGEIVKVALSSTDDIRIQSIDLVETHAYGTKQKM